MAEDEVYLYLNEGGFKPGMYECVRRDGSSFHRESRKSAWRWIPGIERGKERERKSAEDSIPDPL